MTGCVINELMTPRLEKAGLGKLLTDDSLKHHCDGNNFFEKDALELGWRLASKTVIPNSTGINYLAQTEILAEYIEHHLYRNMKIPSGVYSAILMFHDIKSSIPGSPTSLEVIKWLVEIEINKRFRNRFVDSLNQMALNLALTGDRLAMDLLLFFRPYSGSGWWPRCPWRECP